VGQLQPPSSPEQIPSPQTGQHGSLSSPQPCKTNAETSGATNKEKAATVVNESRRSDMGQLCAAHPRRVNAQRNQSRFWKWSSALRKLVIQIETVDDEPAFSHAYRL
jgi:hypothetical protein